MLSSIRLSLLVWFWFMSHVSDPYVIIGIMHDSIRVQMVSSLCLGSCRLLLCTGLIVELPLFSFLFL